MTMISHSDMEKAKVKETARELLEDLLRASEKLIEEHNKKKKEASDEPVQD